MKKNVYVLIIDEENPTNSRLERFKNMKEYEGYYKKTPGILITGKRQLNKLMKEYEDNGFILLMLERVNFD